MTATRAKEACHTRAIWGTDAGCCAQNGLRRGHRRGDCASPGSEQDEGSGTSDRREEGERRMRDVFRWEG